jgi:branched-chain amino acid transport system substrate-binding protein
VTAQVPARFTTAYQAKFGTLPDVFAAEAYDQTWWIARAIKQAGSANPADVAAALLQVGKKGFTGAQGALTFENGNDAKTKGVLVQWDGSKQTIAQ